MKITVNRKALSAALAKLTKATGTGMSIFAGFRLYWNPGRIGVESTDLKTWISTEIQAETEGAGEIVLNLKQTLAALKTSTAPEVAISGKKGSEVVTVGDCPVAALDAEKYPKSPTDPAKWTKAPEGLAEQMRRAALYMSDDESRYFMCGIFLAAEGRIVGTDGRRLYKSREIPLPGIATGAEATANKDGILIPPLPWTPKVIARYSADHKASRFFLDMDGFQVSVPIIQAQFPNYDRVIPDNGQPAKLDCPAELGALAESIGKYAKTDPDFKRHKRIWITGGRVVSDTKNPFSLPLAEPEAAGLSIAVNYDYLADLGKTFPVGQFRLDPEAPSKKALTWTSPEGDVAVIMPMQMDGGPNEPKQESQQASNPAPQPEAAPSTPDPEEAPKAQETQESPEPVQPTSPQPEEHPAQQATRASADPAAVKAAILAVLKAGGSAEQVGAWIWCKIAYEDTEAREALKAGGFFWSRARKAWYHSPTGRTPGTHAARGMDPAAKYGRAPIQSAEEVTA